MFRKKDRNIRGILEEHVRLLNKLNTKIEELSGSKIREYNTVITDLRDEVKGLKEDKTNLNTQLRSLKASTGGYKKEINKLNNELEETKTKLNEAENELKSTYRVKRIPSDKPTHQAIGVKPSKSANTQTRKILEEKAEIRDGD